MENYTPLEINSHHKVESNPKLVNKIEFPKEVGRTGQERFQDQQQQPQLMQTGGQQFNSQQPIVQGQRQIILPGKHYNKSRWF
jgi:hypothetical protein